MSRLASRSASVLCVLTALFGTRVVGQALVAFLDVAWLPAMDTWDSGLLPYAVLLPIQIITLLVQAVVDRDVRRGRGFFAHPRPRAGGALRWCACVYALGMVVRYAITRLASDPDRLPLGVGRVSLHAWPVHVRFGVNRCSCSSRARLAGNRGDAPE